MSKFSNKISFSLKFQQRNKSSATFDFANKHSPRMKISSKLLRKSRSELFIAVLKFHINKIWAWSWKYDLSGNLPVQFDFAMRSTHVFLCPCHHPICIFHFPFINGACLCNSYENKFRGDAGTCIPNLNSKISPKIRISN